MAGEHVTQQPGGHGADPVGPRGFGVPAAGPDTLVTILIDNYNYGRYLAQAVDSALAQTHPRVEVLVVDDHSTDDSREVLARYGDRVVAVLLDRNVGQAGAVNAGLARASGSVVVMLDADDVLAADTVARAVVAFAADPRCVRVQWRLTIVDADGRATGATVPPRRWPLLTGDLGPAFRRYRLFRVPPASGNAYSTAALRALPPVPEDVFRQAVDRWWSDLTTLLGTVRALEGVGGEYRVHGSNDHVRIGRGREFFQRRVALTAASHEAARALAARWGLPAVPERVDAALDGAFLTWLVVLRKLGEPVPSSASLPQLGARGAYALLRRPDQPLRVRVRRTAWFLALLAVPARSPLVQSVIDYRYSRDSH